MNCIPSTRRLEQLIEASAARGEHTTRGPVPALPAILRAAVLAAALAVAGCNSTYMREGAGIDLPQASIAQQTDLEEIYIGHLCKQAGLVPLGSDTCEPQRGGTSAWRLVMKAGLNDIDRRCDGYLGWIDTQRRNAGPLQQQITDIRTATAAILTASGVGGSAMGVVAAAFGLASSSLANFNSRLIMQLDQTTVQSVVLNRQQRFREELEDRSISDRPSAIYVLRSYLRICMPFTIETEINSALTTLARTGEPPDQRLALASPRLAGTPLTSASRLPDAPRRPPQPREARFELFFANYNPQRLPRSTASGILAKICASPAQIAAGSARIGELIQIYKDHEYERESEAAPVTFQPKPGATLDDADIRWIQGNEYAPTCGQARNYFEKTFFGYGAVPSAKVARLDRMLGVMTASARTLPQLRASIRQARACLGQTRTTSVDDEITPDIWDAMGKADPGSCAKP